MPQVNTIFSAKQNSVFYFSIVDILCEEIFLLPASNCESFVKELTGFICLQVQRPGIEPIIYRDLFLFRTLASFLNGISIQKLGCNAELIVDEFGEKLLEELDYTLVLFIATLMFDINKVLISSPHFRGALLANNVYILGFTIFA